MTEPLLELNVRPVTLPDGALLRVATVDQEKYTPPSVVKARDLWISTGIPPKGIAILLLIAFINGVRGTFALYTLKAKQAAAAG